MTAEQFSIEDSWGLEAVRVRKWRAAFWAIVVATVIAFLTCSVASGSAETRSRVMFVTLISLCNLLGFWLGLGNSVWRIPTAVFGSLLVAFGFAFTNARVSATNLFEIGSMTCGITFITAATCFLLKLFCGRLTLSPSIGSSREALQFGVRHLLIWTTVIACMIALVRQFAGGAEYSSHIAGIITVLVGAFSAVAVLEIWAILGERIVLNRCVVVAIALLLVQQVMVAISAGQHLLWSIIIVGSQTIFMATIFCLRMQGYRFVRYQA